MALTRRTVTTTLAVLAVAGAAAQPAQAYWRSNGAGAGAVPTYAAAANVLSLGLTPGTGHSVTAAGKAGSTSSYVASVTIYLCKTSPCNQANASATLTTSVTGGNYSIGSGNLNGWPNAYGQVTQLQTSGWRDYATAPTAVSKP